MKSPLPSNLLSGRRGIAIALVIIFIIIAGGIYLYQGSLPKKIGDTVTYDDLTITLANLNKGPTVTYKGEQLDQYKFVVYVTRNITFVSGKPLTVHFTLNDTSITLTNGKTLEKSSVLLYEEPVMSFNPDLTYQYTIYVPKDNAPNLIKLTYTVGTTEHSTTWQA